jgi:hypothetical protein
MVSRSGGRVRRLIITGVVAAGLGAGATGIALASTGGSGTGGTTATHTAATTSSSSSPSSKPSSAPAAPGGREAPAGTHHCTHMGTGQGGTSAS